MNKSNEELAKFIYANILKGPVFNENTHGNIVFTPTHNSLLMIQVPSDFKCLIKKGYLVQQVRVKDDVMYPCISVTRKGAEWMSEVLTNDSETVSIHIIVDDKKIKGEYKIE